MLERKYYKPSTNNNDSNLLIRTFDLLSEIPELRFNDKHGETDALPSPHGKYAYFWDKTLNRQACPHVIETREVKNWFETRDESLNLKSARPYCKLCTSIEAGEPISKNLHRFADQEDLPDQVEKIFNVQGVVRKSGNHPWIGKSHPETGTYMIDGEEAPPLSLERGKLYVFKITVPREHPFYVTTSEIGASNANPETKIKEETFSGGTKDKGISNGLFFLYIPLDFEHEKIFYQCINHERMGGVIIIQSPVGEALFNGKGEWKRDVNVPFDPNLNILPETPEIFPESPESPESPEPPEPQYTPLPTPPEITPELHKVVTFNVRKVANSPILGVVTEGIADPNNPNKLFLLEQAGRILHIDLASSKLDVMLDLTDTISRLEGRRDPFSEFADERGLFGIALHPEFSNPNSQRWKNIFFCHYSMSLEGFNYTDLNHHSSVSMFEMVPGDLQKTRDSEVRLFTVGQPQMNHNGGTIAFNPGEPRYLYVGFGDGGGGNDEHGELLYASDKDSYIGNASTLPQNRTNLHGAIYKIDLVDFIDNYVKKNATQSDRQKYLIEKSLLYYGFRNPWKFSFDENGRMFIADVGQNRYEEVHIVDPPHSVVNNPKHFGWRAYEASHVFNQTVIDYLRDNGIVSVKPSIEYSRSGEVPSAIIGGYYSQVTRSYIFGDYNGKLFAAIQNPIDMKWHFREQMRLPPQRFIHSFARNSTKHLFILVFNRQDMMNEIYSLHNFFSAWMLPQPIPKVTDRWNIFIKAGVQSLDKHDLNTIFFQAYNAMLKTPSSLRRNVKGDPVDTRMKIAVMTVVGVAYYIDTPGSWIGSADISKGKAFTALAFSSKENALTTRSIGELSQPNKPLWGIDDTNQRQGIVTFPGGIPLYKGGELVGGIGVSGDGVDQDEIVAFKGARGFYPPEAIRIDTVTGGEVNYVGDKLKKSLNDSIHKMPKRPIEYSRFEIVSFPSEAFPSEAYNKIVFELRKLYKLCEPDEPEFKPSFTPSQLIVGYSQERIASFLVISDTLEMQKDEPRKDFEQKGGLWGVNGLFVTSVCGDTETYHGLLKELFAQLISFASAKRYTYLLLHVSSTRTWLLRKYEGLGFEKSGEFTDDTETFLIMRMELSSRFSFNIGGRDVKRTAARSMDILSPVWGTVERVTGTRETGISIRIAIAVSDIKKIHAPISGVIEEIKFEEGEFKHNVFEVPTTKTGRATVFIKGKKDIRLNFWLEVGEGYVTNRIKFDKVKGDHVNAGEEIGEILLGSLAELHLPPSTDALTVMSLVQANDKVKGGSSIIAWGWGLPIRG